MAVPKKRTSKMKTRLRKSQWKFQANKEATKALSKAKTVIKGLLAENSLKENNNELESTN